MSLKELLSHEEISRNAIYYRRESDNIVYFLLRYDEIVYVGVTGKLQQRLDTHTKDKDFDSYAFIKFKDRKTAEIMECRYILEFRPQYNKSIQPSDLITLNMLRNTIKSLDNIGTKYYKKNVNKVIKKLDVPLVEFNGTYYVNNYDVLRIVEELTREG